MNMIGEWIDPVYTGRDTWDCNGNGNDDVRLRTTETIYYDNQLHDSKKALQYTMTTTVVVTYLCLVYCIYTL